MAPPGAYMRATDAFAWHMERDPALRSTVVVLLWLDRAPSWERFADRVDRMSRLMPSMRQRVVAGPVPLSNPRWTYDAHFDLQWHLRRVTAPKPRTRDTVLEMARQTAMDSFDRDRPLWEFTLVEGLQGGEAALVAKIHHSLTDGVGGMRLLTVLFDLQRRPPDLGGMPPAPAGEDVSVRAEVTDAVGAMAEHAAHLARRGAGVAVPTLAHWVRHPVWSAVGATAMARSVYRTAAPISDTLSPVMRERAMVRRLATAEVPLAALRSAAETVHATVNDAYLTAVTGALRRYHQRHDVTVDALRVTMPISIRADDDLEWGNRITLQRLTLPVGEPDPSVRMQLVHRVIQAARDEPSLPVTDAIAGGLNLLPSAYVGGVLKHVDFLASNVPGSPVPIYLAGSLVTGFFAFGPTIGASLNTTLISYRDSCLIGINIDTAAVPDPDVFMECLRESLDEVTGLGAVDETAAP